MLAHRETREEGDPAQGVERFILHGAPRHQEHVCAILNHGRKSNILVKSVALDTCCCRLCLGCSVFFHLVGCQLACLWQAPTHVRVTKSMQGTLGISLHRGNYIQAVIMTVIPPTTPMRVPKANAMFASLLE